MSKTLILCDCQKTQTIDTEALETLDSVTCTKVHSGLCTSEIEKAAEFVTNCDALIACGQQRNAFVELAEELSVNPPQFVDLRDRAGWSEDGKMAGPKMAALAAESLLEAPLPKVMDVVSEGLCLILGTAEVVHPVAEKLSDFLSVTVLVADSEDLPPDLPYQVIAGKLRSATGALGQFEVRIDAFRQVDPGGRGAARWTEPQDGARSQCDLILDLTGGTPLFPAPEKREGYLRADPSVPMQLADAMVQASHMIGTFEKPLYVALEEHLCAHSRAEQEGCRNCLDICPTGAITPNGDHVAIDPMICAGCGACTSLCPSGAITYDDPPLAFTMQRIQTLSQAYRAAGGTSPRLLVCDTDFGAEMIGFAARFDRGLPADVIPLELNKITGFGHAEILGALSSGFVAVDVLLSPKAERDVIEGEVALANALSDQPRVRVLDINDPEALPSALFAVAPTPLPSDPILPMGSRRQITRQAAKALHPESDATLPLPAEAPYGAVLVDQDSCTLCLSCVSLCPSGALTDNPDRPQLKFQEDACLQCGLCATACPEDAIALQPQFNLSDEAFAQVTKNEEDPAECIECGALFGVQSTIDRIVEQLAGKHAMFANGDAARMIRMCDDCRVKSQFKAGNTPFQGGDRPMPRTTDDYYSDRKDH